MKDYIGHNIIKTLPPSLERLPLFIVGDVHGCSRELRELIKEAKKKITNFQLVLVGDLFTKGPDPVGVYEQILEHSAICIKGNHDWALKALISRSMKYENPQLSPHSKQTLNLIRYHKKGIYDLLLHLPHAVTTTIFPAFVRTNWEKSYPLIVVHAGLDCTKGLAGSTERMLLTARYVRWDVKDNEKKLVPVGNQSGYKNQPDVFRWHELHDGPELIIFGHDAKQGLFRKALPSGRPICVGIDTGCTYGKMLTGYFPERDLAVQVKAHREYFDAKKNMINVRSDI